MASTNVPAKITYATALCGYCGSTYDIAHGHRCSPTVQASSTATQGTWLSPDCLCPDLLRYEQIGAADGLRGRVVRAVFWLLRAWPPRR